MELLGISEQLIESLPDAVFVVNPEGRIVFVNSQAEVLFGYDREDLLGEPIEVLVPEEVRPAHPDYRNRYLADPVVRPMGAGLDLSGRRKDGSKFAAEISLSAIETADGRLVTAVVRDATERKAFEAVVARARDVAEKAARSRQEFLANMSHEIRTPMNAVIGMTSLLLDTSLDTDQRDYVETVRASGDHLLTIINDILDYSKIDAGKLVLEQLPFELRPWLSESLDLISAQAHEKGLEVLCDVSPEVASVIVGDPSRLRQVLVNLLSNAVKFTDAGEVVVRLSRTRQTEDGVELQLEVRDTGVGVPPERIEALFDPFIQADTTTTRMYGGTGLGLAISRQLVERMGGSISMESVPSVGTTVRFTFTAGHSDAAFDSPPEGLHGARMLIVDDNATNVKILESWAARHQMRSRSATSASEALRIVEQDIDFRFAILDLMMPDMDGAELGVLLKARLPKTRLILLSSAGPYAREVAGRGTFDAVLSKPANQEQMFRLLGGLQEGAPVDHGTVQSSPSAFELPGTHRALSILVVEDNPVNQKVARHLLARFGYRTDVAASGHEAVSALEQRSYDLVFMDVQMPDMDGLEATRVIRARWPGRPVRIVAMTANVAPEDVRQCRDAGMDDFLGKPIVVEELAAVLRSLIEPTTALPATDRGAIVDAQVLARLCSQIGSDTVRELADMFSQDLLTGVPALVDSCRDEDRPALSATAHRLKSSSRALGAQVLGGKLSDLEIRATEADWPILRELVSVIEDLQKTTVDLVLAEIPAS